MLGYSKKVSFTKMEWVYLLGVGEWKYFDKDFWIAPSHPFEREKNPASEPAFHSMVESFFGKIPDMVEKAVNIVKGKKKGE